MRLLHTKSLTFEEFFDGNTPKYAILSHRWGENEVSFKEMRKGTAQPGQGLSKILYFCSRAANRGFEWVWIDTCCIDKRSSAELTEAINSMFRWYKGAAVCFAYLSDVKYDQEAKTSSMESFRQSAWFTRGWTLQELLANSSVRFFDQQWKEIGSKAHLIAEISAVTRIPQPYLEMNSNTVVDVASSAMKMSWVSGRQTSRVEDMAYCLMGLFDVNMPLLYGEGEKAFMRLQLEIIKKSDDNSIFAWSSDSILQYDERGLLAPSPSQFAGSGALEHQAFPKQDRDPWTMTNVGLELQLPLASFQTENSDMIKCGGTVGDKVTFTLDCHRDSLSRDDVEAFVMIRLERGLTGWSRVSYTLEFGPEAPHSASPSEMQKIYIKQYGL